MFCYSKFYTVRFLFSICENSQNAGVHKGFSVFDNENNKIQFASFLGYWLTRNLTNYETKMTASTFNDTVSYLSTVSV